MEWLGLANQGWMTGKGLSKGPEAPISVDVVRELPNRSLKRWRERDRGKRRAIHQARWANRLAIRLCGSSSWRIARRQGLSEVWIVSKDSDYLTKVYGDVLVDPFLHHELMKACGDDVEVRCFDNAMTAIEDFVKTANVPAEKLPTEERAREIEEELRALPPFGWSASSNWDDAVAARHGAVVNARFDALDDGGVGQFSFVSGPSLHLTNGVAEEVYR
jgi:hypothetical protein